jgi:hypothetical protein
MDPLASRISESRLAPLVAWIAVAAVAVTLWVMVRHGLAIPASADDFCNRNNALAGTALEATLSSYEGWTGRLVTTFVLYHALRLVDLPQLATISGVLPLLLALGTWLIAGAFGARHVVDRLAIAAFLFVAIVLGLHHLTGQVVFWATGGIVYLLPFVLLAAWLATMARIAEGKPSRVGVLGAFALGALAGNAIELTWSALAIVGLAVLAHVRGQPQLLRRAAAALAGAVAGAAILAAAPGNYVRATATERSFSLDASWLAGEYARMLGEVFAKAPGFLAGLLALVVVGLVVHTPNLTTHWRQRALIAALLVVAALASLLPVLAVPPQFAPRNGFFLLVLLLAAAAAFAVPPILAMRYGALLLAGTALAGSLLLPFRYAEDTQVAQLLSARWTERHHVLRAAASAGRKDVVLARMPFYPRPTVHALELGDDPARWDNKCVARYYGLASVTVPAER